MYWRPGLGTETSLDSVGPHLRSPCHSQTLLYQQLNGGLIRSVNTAFCVASAAKSKHRFRVWRSLLFSSVLFDLLNNYLCSVFSPSDEVTQMLLQQRPLILMLPIDLLVTPPDTPIHMHVCFTSWERGVSSLRAPSVPSFCVLETKGYDSDIPRT